jgi:hypothetical protein
LIDRWIVQDNLRQQLTNIRHKLSLLNSIKYYTDGSLSTRITDDDFSHYMADNITVGLGIAFYTNNEVGEFLVCSQLSL